MGCGSSTAQPLDPVVPAAAAKPKGGTSPPAALKPLPVQVEQQGGASAVQQQQQPPPVADTPRTKQQKQKLRKHSGEGDAVGAQGAASPASPAGAELPPPPPCDGDPTHEAVWWCAQCEESLCDACDAAAHQRDAAHRHEHRRTKLGEAGGGKRKSDDGSSPKQPKSKFVVRSTAPVTPAGSAPSPRGGEVAAADGSATPGAGGSATPKFKVGKFASEESTPSPAGPGSSAAARIKHSPTDAGQGGALGSLEESELSRMTRGELELLWHRYDKDRNNVLDRGELRRLAADVIARLLQLVRDDLREKQPHRSEAELDELVAREKLFVLPGKDVKETQRHMTNTLQKTLDINSDGKVTKQEYLAQWNVFAADVFQLKQEGALECSIM